MFLFLFLDCPINNIIDLKAKKVERSEEEAEVAEEEEKVEEEQRKNKEREEELEFYKYERKDTPKKSD